MWWCPGRAVANAFKIPESHPPHLRSHRLIGQDTTLSRWRFTGSNPVGTTHVSPFFASEYGPKSEGG